jgi:hypothetical protein
MPIHDWTLVDAGLFHDFHQSWTVKLCDALNRGILPSDHFALIEQKSPSKQPDLLTLELSPEGDDSAEEGGGLAVATPPPKTRFKQFAESVDYAARANRITVRHRHGDVVAIFELMSPGNKSRKKRFRKFVEKAAAFIDSRISMLIVDLFPPTKRDPVGVHKSIWDEFEEQPFKLPTDKPLVLAAYDAGPPLAAYIETIAVGDPLPEMPIFLRPEIYVNAPLESTYQEAWAAFPKQLKGLLESPRSKKKK